MLSHDTPTAARSAAESSYIVGQDPNGQWLAIDTTHRGGGVFASRAAAIHFAAFESGRRADGIRVSPIPLRLEF